MFATIIHCEEAGHDYCRGPKNQMKAFTSTSYAKREHGSKWLQIVAVGSWWSKQKRNRGKIPLYGNKGGWSG